MTWGYDREVLVEEVDVQVQTGCSAVRERTGSSLNT